MYTLTAPSNSEDSGAERRRCRWLLYPLDAIWRGASYLASYIREQAYTVKGYLLCDDSHTS